MDCVINFYLDFRPLNAATILDIYPLPRMDAFIRNSGGAQMLTELDAQYRYLRKPIKDEDEHKTMSTVQFAIYCYKIILFDLGDESATFQCAFSTILSGV